MSSRIIPWGGGVFVGLMLAMLLPSTASVTPEQPAEATAPLSEPLTTPLTRAVVLNREPCECARYRMVSLPGTDHTAVLRVGGELPTGQGGIAQPENIP